MPRILHRLIEKLSSSWQTKRRVPPQASRRQSPISLFRPPLPLPSWSPLGRTKSLILDDLNPLIHRKRYELHKTLPPKLRVHYQRKKNPQGGDDLPREMTEQERTWWSSPYCLCTFPGIEDARRASWARIDVLFIVF